MCYEVLQKRKKRKEKLCQQNIFKVMQFLSYSYLTCLFVCVPKDPSLLTRHSASPDSVMVTGRSTPQHPLQRNPQDGTPIHRALPPSRVLSTGQHTEPKPQHWAPLKQTETSLSTSMLANDKTCHELSPVEFREGSSVPIPQKKTGSTPQVPSLPAADYTGNPTLK